MQTERNKRSAFHYQVHCRPRHAPALAVPLVCSPAAASAPAGAAITRWTSVECQFETSMPTVQEGFKNVSSCSAGPRPGLGSEEAAPFANATQERPRSVMAGSPQAGALLGVSLPFGNHYSASQHSGGASTHTTATKHLLCPCSAEPVPAQKTATCTGRQRPLVAAPSAMPLRAWEDTMSSSAFSVTDVHSSSRCFHLSPCSKPVVLTILLALASQ